MVWGKSKSLERKATKTLTLLVPILQNDQCLSIFPPKKQIFYYLPDLGN